MAMTIPTKTVMLFLLLLLLFILPNSLHCFQVAAAPKPKTFLSKPKTSLPKELKEKKTWKFPWEGGFKSVTGEHKDANCKVSGAIPREIRGGSFYRIGPGRFEIGSDIVDHWLDGDGMVSHWHFSDTENRVSFQNRFVRTPLFEKEEAAGRRLYPTPHQQGPFGFLGNFVTINFKLPLPNVKIPVNDNLFFLNDRLYVGMDAAPLFELDPTTLEIKKTNLLDETLPNQALICGHHHTDVETGETFSFVFPVDTIGKVFNPVVEFIKLDSERGCQRDATVPLSDMNILHDFGLTSSNIVLLTSSCAMRLRSILNFRLGLRTFSEGAMTVEKDLMAKILLMDRKTHMVRKIDFGFRGITLHFANSYDDGDDVIIDCCCYDQTKNTATPFDNLQQNRKGLPSVARARLVRFRVKPDDTVLVTKLSNGWMEACQINASYESKRHDFIYCLEQGKDCTFGRYIYKIDVRDVVENTNPDLAIEDQKGALSASDREIRFDLGEECYGNEPTFVPREGTAGGNVEQDDGWLLVQVNDGKTETTHLKIIDARIMKEVGRVDLSFHLPFSNHGKFHHPRNLNNNS